MDTFSTYISGGAEWFGKNLTDTDFGLVANTDDESSTHLLSPDSPDIAVSSFSSFSNTGTQPFRVVAQLPPASIREAQMNAGGFEFLTDLAQTKSTDSGDELFAKALSPRTPDLPRSPFSFSLQDTKSYAVNKQA